ncbi:hypothetical protein Cme02nite_76050 [Catellatospora methionotrophica]|uniref:DinB family protein n=1 Tax=Catellatospora methionotrophica TaxID=121620 RepID=A0A8J3LJ41_9ACTN|nr:DinB family protein [Catellatospora methionotrophica]GIG19273.1 hypothetical protein Cme02nite_76050 [Catellatospora methionotrophica]
MIDERFELPTSAGERQVLETFLEFQRGALVRKCADLDDRQFRSRSVPTSRLSLAGLVRHLAGVERWYFQAVIADAFPGSLFTTFTADFDDVEAATCEATFDMWQAEVETSRRIAAERSLNVVGRHPGTGEQHSLRWVLHHMIDEYARHLGHADMLREAIDGRTGE